MQTLVSLFGRDASAWMRTSLLGVERASRTQASIRDWYDLLAAYYYSNGLYQVLRDAAVTSGLGGEALRSLRNPAFRATEFHASHLWPGSLPDALPIVTENERIIDPIQQLWQWSNFGAQKQIVARTLPMLGDWFCKVRSSGDMLPLSERRVWFQMIEPRHVTEFVRDDRGFLTYVRIDVPQVSTDSAGVVNERWSHVEVWSKALGTYRQWRYVGESVSVPVEQLTGLQVDEPLEALNGVDFIPIVHVPFRDVGDTRGVGCFVPVLDKIDEVNRLATRLHQMGFRNMRNIWASLRDGQDSSNRPLPPASVGARFKEALGLAPGREQPAQSQVTETFIDLPGATRIESLVPDLKYDALLATVQDQLAEIGNDLPEIRWYSLSEQGADLSSRAIRLLMAPAVARVEEGRGNAETGLARLDQMALSMGQAIGLWLDAGRYERGDFEHSFEHRDVMPLSDIDEAEAHRARAQAAQGYTSAGVPLMTVLTDVMDKTDEEARAILSVAAQAADAAADRAAQAFGTGDTEDDDES